MTQTLLGHLAKFGSFFVQGEVLCTRGLAYLLQDLEARSAFAAEIATRTGVKIGDDLTWHAEAHHECDSGRSDLEARTGDGPPTVEIEAKLTAALSGDQLVCYLKRLPGGSREGVLLVLVPRGRTNEATTVVNHAFDLSGFGPWRPAEYPGVAIAVVSWDDVLAVLGRVESQRFLHELEQFQSMYSELSGGYIAPLAGPEELAEWRERETDFVKMIERATRRLTADHKLLPMGVEPLEQVAPGLEPKGYQRRYVCRPPGGASPCFSIGVRDSFEGFKTPVWLRFHKGTSGFSGIRNRIDSSPIKLKVVDSGGHIWIPLDVPLKKDDEQMINELVAQAEEIIKVAYGPTS